MGISISEFYNMEINEMIDWINIFDEGNKIINKMLKKNQNS